MVGDRWCEESVQEFETVGCCERGGGGGVNESVD